MLAAVAIVDLDAGLHGSAPLRLRRAGRAPLLGARAVARVAAQQAASKRQWYR